MAKLNVIQILDNEKGLVKIEANKKYKLVNPDGKDVGSFTISGVPAVINPDITDQDGRVALDGVPFMGQTLFIDVNHDAGLMTKIKNPTSGKKFNFQVTHADLGKKPVIFEPWDSQILNPKPVKISWTFYDINQKADRVVTINITPLPVEHAIEIRFTVK